MFEQETHSPHDFNEKQIAHDLWLSEKLLRDLLYWYGHIKVVVVYKSGVVSVVSTANIFVVVIYLERNNARTGIMIFRGPFKLQLYIRQTMKIGPMHTLMLQYIEPMYSQ